MLLQFQLNGKKVNIDTHPLRRLLDVLRDDFGLKGVKEGCGEGECGACSIFLNGDIVNSCLVPVGSASGSKIVTIEGFRETKRFEILEKAFSEASSVQCGFCTTGFIMAAEAVLARNPAPTETEIREGIAGNLCRCTGYNMIVRGIQIASERGNGVW